MSSIDYSIKIFHKSRQRKQKDTSDYFKSVFVMLLYGYPNDDNPYILSGTAVRFFLTCRFFLLTIGFYGGNCPFIKR